MSNEMTEGARVRVFCSKSPGAFLNEYLISIDTQDGPISGFIDASEVEVTDRGDNYVWGIVHKVEKERIVIDLPGSFFTTTGIAHFSRQVLESYL